MTTHFYTFSDAKGGSSRQRAFKVVDELRSRGHNVVIHTPPVLFISRTPWPKKATLIWQILKSLLSIKKGDCIYLQRTISNKYFFVIMVAYIKVFRRKMIFDFDDPVYTHSYLKTKVFSQMADAVITCTHEQARIAREWNANVHIIHIALDHMQYKKFTKDYFGEPERLTIGWVGTGPEHMRNLQNLAAVFAELLQKQNVPSFSFVLIGAVGHKPVYELFQKVPGLQTTFIDALDWQNPESVPREIQKFDIGVIPHRIDGIWNKGKSSFKVLEYMACGVATLCSRFGEMPYIIDDGKNGYLAESTEEWVEKMQKLLQEKSLRAQLGAAGQKTIHEEYSFEAIIPKLEKILYT